MIRQQRRTWRARFADAFRGLRYGLQGQASFQVHFLAALAVIVAGLLVQLTTVEWALIALAIGLVFAAELANTSLEWLARAVSEQHDERIGKALDLASAAVLAASLTAVVVGLCVFGPRLW
jgi:diacylglycerol kinase